MTQQEIDKFMKEYEALMREVNARISVMQNIFERSTTTGYNRIDVEVMYLQIRKILEIVAFGSLLLNESAVRKVRNNIENKLRSAKTINEELEKINKYFYPVPVVVVNDPEKPQKDAKKLYLTKQEFNDFYGIASQWIHTQNPLKGIAYDLTDKKFQRELEKINNYALKLINLLSYHQLKPLPSSKDHFFQISLRSIPGLKVMHIQIEYFDGTNSNQPHTTRVF